MSVRLTIVGHGDATDPDAPNTSLLVRGEGWPTLLLDCGYAVPHAAWRCGLEPGDLDAVWLSHTHADHAFGLPALLLWMRLAGRTRPLHVLGQAETLERARAILDAGYPGSFAPHKCYPIAFTDVNDCAFGGAFGGVSLGTAATEHKVQNHALRLERAGISVAYSGDGAPTSESLALYQNVDWLVHECASLEQPIGGHANLRTLVPAIESAGVGNLVLVHQAPSERLAIATELRLAARNERRPRIHLPKPGDELRLHRRT